MLDIHEYINIRNYCTLRVGGQFRYMISIAVVDQLIEAYNFAVSKNLPVFILGGGSNMVFRDGIFDAVVLKMEMMGIEIVTQTDEYTDIKVGSGENWDNFVGYTISLGLSGIEALSAIPGTIGATPVQNVGAYGQEIKDTLVSVDVFDTTDGRIKILSNTDCKFSYRDSIFKGEAKGRYVILAVTYRLSKQYLTIPNYPGVKKYFIENIINNPTLSQIRIAITEIRRTKLPDPKEIANVGSFFKNPIVDKNIAHDLKVAYPDMTIFLLDDTHTKLSAGWLIETAGLKGKDFGSLSTYSHNALVLVNNGTATRKDVEDVSQYIIKTVQDKFGITLETEPEFA